MNIYNILGGLGAAFPFGAQQSQFDGFESFRNQCGELARQQQFVSVPTPEEGQQWERKLKNARNYERWLARMKREPLEDVPFR